MHNSDMLHTHKANKSKSFSELILYKIINKKKGTFAFVFHAIFLLFGKKKISKTKVELYMK